MLVEVPRFNSRMAIFAEIKVSPVWESVIYPLMEPVFCESAVVKLRADKKMNSSKCFVNGTVNFLSI